MSNVALDDEGTRRWAVLLLETDSNFATHDDDVVRIGFDFST